MGVLDDLVTLRFEGLSLSAENVEFNVLAVGHEFWVAVQNGTVIGLAVLAKSNHNLRILHLEVSPSRKNEGIGSGLLRTIMGCYPQCGLSVTPSRGVEDFYQTLGFTWFSRWEMHREPFTREAARRLRFTSMNQMALFAKG
jgi:N-acetylglutamate synthase-like GNAT family acetyltransferase